MSQIRIPGCHCPSSKQVFRVTTMHHALFASQLTCSKIVFSSTSIYYGFLHFVRELEQKTTETNSEHSTEQESIFSKVPPAEQCLNM